MADKRILIVDDDADLVEALTLALRSRGYHVTSAATGKEAWEKAQQTPPDLAIIDVMMETVSDGIQLTHRLRQNERLKNVPILMLTAVNQAFSLNLDRETEDGYLPVDKFLEKPVEPAALLKEVEALL